MLGSEHERLKLTFHFCPRRTLCTVHCVCVGVRKIKTYREKECVRERERESERKREIRKTNTREAGMR